MGSGQRYHLSWIPWIEWELANEQWEKNIVHGAGRALAWQIQRSKEVTVMSFVRGKWLQDEGWRHVQPVRNLGLFPKDTGVLLNGQWYNLNEVFRLALCLLSAFGECFGGGKNRNRETNYKSVVVMQVRDGRNREVIKEMKKRGWNLEIFGSRINRLTMDWVWGWLETENLNSDKLSDIQV